MTDDRTVTASFIPLNYSIAAIASPQSSGEVSGLGNYHFGEDVTITATPTLDGYSFVSWSGDINSTLNPLTINVDSNLSLTANFSLNSYNLDLIASSGGSVEGNGSFTHGTLTEITAIPEQGYSFAGWAGSGIADSHAISTNVNMTANRVISASFTLNQYSLTLLAGNGGNVSGGGTYSHGSNASISAIPDVGYTFTNWTGEGVDHTNALTASVSMTENQTVTALFNLKSYSLDLNWNTGGSVNGEGNYSHGDFASITASPENGYQFEKWSGDIEGNLSSPSRAILMDSSRSIHANFIPLVENNFALTILSNPQTGGSSFGAGSYRPETSVSISADPLTGYEFVSWTGSGIQDLNSSHTNIVMSENNTITANFQKKTLILQIEEAQGGTTTGAGKYKYGTDVNITALPNIGFTFSGWTGKNVDNPGNASTFITLNQDTNITAIFSIENRSISLNPSEGGTVTGSGTYPFGTEIEIQAFPQPGYRFVKWIGAQIGDVESPNLDFPLTENLNMTAQFSKETYTLIVKNSSGGTTSGGGSFYYNAFAPVGAYPGNGYVFNRWEGENVVSPNLPLTSVYLTKDQNITAIFSTELIVNEINSTVKIANNWYDSAWFGTFFQNVNGWTYHLEFGWIYPVVEDNKNIWFWHIHLGWIWAAPDTFTDRYLWSQNSQNWLLWERPTQSTIRFYDYSISDWLSFP
jgi:uncharacterized repeat protein (TIGR02543 family)